MLIDSKGREFTARVIKEDKAKDLLLLEAPTNAPALDIWNDFWQGGLVPGTEIIALGYPGYYGSYTWEHGYVKEIREMPAFGEVVVSKDISFPGLSGGAVIDIRRGKVVGMVVAVAERNVVKAPDQSKRLAVPLQNIRRSIFSVLSQ